MTPVRDDPWKKSSRTTSQRGSDPQDNSSRTRTTGRPWRATRSPNSPTRLTELVDERIFTPLAMDDSTYAQPLPARLESRRAIGYTYQNGEYRAHDPVVWTLPPEGGSLRTTATDMGQFLLTT
ncbi:hypothetical protein ACFQH8_18680 [Halomicroarcula sp. GCM10025710]